MMSGATSVGSCSVASPRKVIVAGGTKLDRLTRSVKDLCALLEMFAKRGVALISVAESPAVFATAATVWRSRAPGCAGQRQVGE
jgi:hypothetical protein